MKILIIEDEPAAVRRLQKLLTDIDPATEIIDAIGSISQAVKWFQEQPGPDIVLMDIHLADGSSFEIFEKTEVTAPVIFTTAYDEYALKAFKVNAIDYLLKPIKQADLDQALQKVAARIKSVHEEENLMQKLEQAGFIKKHRRLLIKMGQTIKLLDLDQVAYFYSRDKISFAVLEGQKRYPLDFSLDQLEQMIDPEKYFRINRQFIVSMEAIEEMIAYSKSRVKLKLKPHTEEDAIVSKERSPEFKKWLLGGE